MSPLDSKPVIEGFLTWFNTVWDYPEPVSLDEVSRYIAPGIQFYLNGEKYAEGVSAYLDRLNALKRQCRMLKIHFPVETILCEGQRVAVTYRETLTYQDGSIHNLVDAAFFELDANGKITWFFDVFNGSDLVDAKT